MITESELINELKKGFTGSDDYLSGVNDGMFTLLNKLTDKIKSMEDKLEAQDREHTVDGFKNEELWRSNVAGANKIIQSLQSQLESLQKENGEMKGALRFLCSKEHIEQDTYTAHIERYIKHFNL